MIGFSRGLGLLSVALLAMAACGDDDGGAYGTQADQVGVGAACASTADCPQPEDGSFELECLTAFTDGYCGLAGCTVNADCPQGSACATHDDGHRYCFRLCRDKPECNVNRRGAEESNCSSNIDFIDAAEGAKACVPPSSGTG